MLSFRFFYPATTVTGRRMNKIPRTPSRLGRIMLLGERTTPPHERRMHGAMYQDIVGNHLPSGKAMEMGRGCQGNWSGFITSVSKVLESLAKL